MGLTVQRLDRGKVEDMRGIKVAAETYYVSPTGDKAYKRGDSSMPSGSRLLVRKGSPVDPEVADHYGVETEDAQDVARVPAQITTPPADRSLGVSSLAGEGYRRIEATAEVGREREGHLRDAHRAGTAQGRQAEMLRGALVEERIQEGGGVRRDAIVEPGTHEAAVAGQATGISGNPPNEAVTRRLEQGEREATARHMQSVRDPEAAKAAEERDRRPEDLPETARADSRVEGAAATSTGTVTPTMGATGATVRELAPGAADLQTTDPAAPTLDAGASSGGGAVAEVQPPRASKGGASKGGATGGGSSRTRKVGGGRAASKRGASKGGATGGGAESK
jgi:hypothetical protein